MALTEQSSVDSCIQQLVDAEDVRTETDLGRLRQQLEQQYQAKSQATTLQMAAFVGRQRILTALLATLVVGGGLCWALLIAPAQRHATDSYASLTVLYEDALKEQRRLDDSFRLERQQLRQQLDALSNPSPAKSRPDVPEARPGGSRPKPSSKPISQPKPPCTCTYDDPLCDCASRKGSIRPL